DRHDLLPCGQASARRTREPLGEPVREPADADAPGRRRTDADSGAELAQVAEDALLSSTSPRRQGRLAHRERASLTRKRSLVKSQYRPHPEAPGRTAGGFFVGW